MRRQQAAALTSASQSARFAALSFAGKREDFCLPSPSLQDVCALVFVCVRVCVLGVGTKRGRRGGVVGEPF